MSEKQSESARKVNKVHFYCKVSPNSPIRVRYMRNKPEQTRSKHRVQEIMNATKALIVERGVDSFTMKEIADSAGMKPTALYRYFPNKPAVLKELTVQMFADDDVIKQDMLASSETLEKVIQQGIIKYWKMHQDEQYRIKLNLAIQSDPELWELSFQEAIKVSHEFREAFEEMSSIKDVERLERKMIMNAFLIPSLMNFVSHLEDEEAKLYLDEFLEMTSKHLLSTP